MKVPGMYLVHVFCSLPVSCSLFSVVLYFGMYVHSLIIAFFSVFCFLLNFVSNCPFFLFPAFFCVFCT